MKNVLAIALLVTVPFLLVACIQSSPGTRSLTMQVVGQGTVTPEVGPHQYERATAVEITAEPAPGWLFTHWEGDVVDPLAPKTTIAVDSEKFVRAIFVENIGFSLREAPGGLITQRPNGSRVASRPGGVNDIEYVLIHGISDAAVNPTNPFDIERIRQIFDSYNVEAHYVINRQGSIYRFVEDHLIAHHAGAGSWQGNRRLTNNMNRYSLGIELLGIGTESEMQSVIGAASNSQINHWDRGYTFQQYKALRELVSELMSQYEIPKENVLGHDAYDPGRKWDPGILFDWSQLF